MGGVVALSCGSAAVWQCGSAAVLCQWDSPQPSTHRCPVHIVPIVLCTIQAPTAAPRHCTPPPCRSAFNKGLAEGEWFANPFDLQSKNVANTAVVHWAGKTLALWEVRRCCCCCCCCCYCCC
jgi:hypothetical protein